jgi:hypothetical protein
MGPRYPGDAAGAVAPETSYGKEIDMKIRSIALALGLAAVAGVASAETGVKMTQISSVGAVYGRAGVPTVQLVGPVVTRSADEVVSGATTEQGPTAVAIGTRNADVNAVYGRS